MQNQAKRLSLFGFELTDLVKTTFVEDCSIARQKYDKRVKRYKNLVLRVLQDFPNIHVFDPTPHFCNYDRCLGFIDDFGYLYNDFDHLNRSGSIYYADKLIGNFEFFR